MRKSMAVFAIIWLGFGASCGSEDGESGAPDAAVATAADATPATTWTNFSANFFSTYCFACHGPGDSLRDYSQLAAVRAEQGKIRCGVSPEAIQGCSISSKQFPIGNGLKPSDEERAQLVRWLDDGTVE